VAIGRWRASMPTASCAITRRGSLRMVRGLLYVSDRESGEARKRVLARSAGIRPDQRPRPLWASPPDPLRLLQARLRRPGPPSDRWREILYEFSTQSCGYLANLAGQRKEKIVV
jgi:hypothetical protein